MDCLFCGISSGEIPSEKVYEDEHVVAFKDISPQAPVHILLIPKIHIEGADDIDSKNVLYISKIFEVIPKVTEELGIKGDYRIVNNCGERAGQTIKHIHFHVIGGRDMKWPPG